MTSHEEVEEAMRSELIGFDFSTEEATTAIRNYKTFVEARPAPEPQPEKEEPKQSWFEKHSEVLIKSGFAFLGVIVIVGGEKLGNHLYTTKAWSVIPK